MQLTKRQAVEEHRKMWNWIADRYKAGAIHYVHNLKVLYTERFYPERYIKNRSFCCEYAFNNVYGKCKECPITWGSLEGATCDFSSEHEQLFESKATGLYAQLRMLTSRKDFDNTEAEHLARQIANLPERSDRWLDKYILF